MNFLHPSQASKPSASSREHAYVSDALLKAFPSPYITKILYKAITETPIYSYQVNVRNSRQLLQEGPQPVTRTYPAHVNTHPVLLGKQMMLFAILIQEALCCGTELFENQAEVMVRLVQGVCCYLINNDQLRGSIESVECNLMMGTYHCGANSFRQAWLAFRQSIAVAQMMGIHRSRHVKKPYKTLDPHNTGIEPDFIWFRIVHGERMLCLMLGFPQGSVDSSMACEDALARDGHFGQLDRTHSAVAAAILNGTNGGPSAMDMETVHALDAKLLRAAKAMPPKFWLPFNLAIRRSTKEEFFEGWRFRSHLFHYNLINQLHLPYLLRFRADDTDACAKLACMTASREILIRYNAFRRLRVESGCPIYDLFALMATITLLLAHLDNHIHHKYSNTVAHQRLSDRTMVEQVLDTMCSIFKVTEDAITKSGICMLNCLLRIEEDAGDGGTYTAVSRDECEDRCRESNDEEIGTVLRICIPYFGCVKIVRSTPMSKEAMNGEKSIGTGHVGGFQSTDDGPSNPGPLDLDGIRLSLPINDGRSGQMLSSASAGSSGQQPIVNSNNEDEVLPTLLHQYWNPSSTAGVDDWIFQGVDMSFFDSIYNV